VVVMANLSWKFNFKNLIRGVTWMGGRSGAWNTDSRAAKKFGG